MLIDSDDKLDDLPPEIVITASEKPNRQSAAGGEYGNLLPENEEDYEIKRKTDAELKILISMKKSTLKMVGQHLMDNGEKLRADIRLCEAELERRRKQNTNKQNKAFSTIRKKDYKIYPLLSTVASITAPLTSLEEEHRLEEEYLGGAMDGNSEGGLSVRKKHKSDMDIDGLLGMRRAKRASEKDKMDAFMDAKAERYKVTPIVATSSMKDEFSVSACMLALNATPSVSTNSYNKALHHFTDVTWRKIFMLMPEDRRKGWLDSLDNSICLFCDN